MPLPTAAIGATPRPDFLPALGRGLGLRGGDPAPCKRGNLGAAAHGF